MPDWPSGSALGLRVQRHRVRFPPCAGHFLVTVLPVGGQLLRTRVGHVGMCLGRAFVDRCWRLSGTKLENVEHLPV